MSLGIEPSASWRLNQKSTTELSPALNSPLNCTLASCVSYMFSLLVTVWEDWTYDFCVWFYIFSLQLKRYTHTPEMQAIYVNFIMHLPASPCSQFFFSQSLHQQQSYLLLGSLLPYFPLPLFLNFSVLDIIWWLPPIEDENHVFSVALPIRYFCLKKKRPFEVHTSVVLAFTLLNPPPQF